MLKTQLHYRIKQRFEGLQNLTRTSHARAVVMDEFELDEDELDDLLEQNDEDDDPESRRGTIEW